MAFTATWKKGFESLHAGVDAQEVADAIMAIGDNVTPEQIVKAAKNKESALHACFTWDNKAAADKWRLHEARVLTSHIVIQRSEDEISEGKPEVRFFVQPATGCGYKPVELVLQNQDEYEGLLTRALAELGAFQRKYQRLSELQPVFDAISEFIA